MPVKVYLILKVIDGKAINVIEILPFDLMIDKSIDVQISKELLSKYNLMRAWLDIRHVNTKILLGDSPHLAIFYSSFVPKENVNENYIKYVKDFSTLDIEIQQEVQSSLRISPY